MGSLGKAVQQDGDVMGIQRIPCDKNMFGC